MPIRCLLITMCRIEQTGLVKIIADQLQPRRQAADLTAGQGQARQPGQIDSHGINVRQIHLNRIADFLTQPEGRRRIRRPQNHVALAERGDEILGNRVGVGLGLIEVGYVELAAGIVAAVVLRPAA